MGRREDTARGRYATGLITAGKAGREGRSEVDSSTNSDKPTLDTENECSQPPVKPLSRCILDALADGVDGWSETTLPGTCRSTAFPVRGSMGVGKPAATSSRYRLRASVDSWETVMRCTSGMIIAVVIALLIEANFNSFHSSFLLLPWSCSPLA